MSNQEVWITLRIKSELPVEEDAYHFARRFARTLGWGTPRTPQQNQFLADARSVKVMCVEQEDDIYELED